MASLPSRGSVKRSYGIEGKCVAVRVLTRNAFAARLRMPVSRHSSIYDRQAVIRRNPRQGAVEFYLATNDSVHSSR